MSKKDVIKKRVEPFKPTRVKFSVSEETIKLMAQEILMIGQRHRLQPHELIACFGLISEFLKEQSGVSNVSLEKL